MRCGSTCLVSLHLDKEDWTGGEKGVGGSRWCGEISLDFLCCCQIWILLTC